MRAARAIVTVAALAMPGATVACVGSGDDSATVASVVGVEAGANATTDRQDGASDATSEATASAPVKTSPPPSPIAGIRVANWSPDAPAIDLCLAKHGTGDFRGPMLGDSVRSLDDAGTAAIPFPYASAYTTLSPGQYDARLVVAGALDCRAGIGSDVTNLPALLVDGYATIALIGEANPKGGAPALKLVGFLDDAFANSGAGLRFINATPSASLALADFGEVSGTSFVPLFLAVHFGQAATPAEAVVRDAAATSVDPNGYASIAPLAGATVALRARNGSVNIAVAQGVNAAAGAVVTIVAIGDTSPALVECVDNAGTLSYLGTCGVISAGGDAGGL